MKLNVLRANPAGNITLFVLDPVLPGDRGALAARLMAGTDIEQVGFLCPPLHGNDARMEMAGGEFCGNATRAFGMFTAQRLGKREQVCVEVSGCDRPLTVEIDWDKHTARTQMPLPRSAGRAEADGCPGILVDLGGIAHFVVEGAAPSQEFFEKAESLFGNIPDLDAYGVIFLEPGKMTPLVKVPAANSLVWEGSCGSGTLAAAVAQSLDAPDGPFVRSYIQPAGTVEATVVRQNSEAVAAYIGGPVELDPVASVEL